LEYKLLALDLDGTLYTSDNRITKNTRKIIKQAREKGLLVTLATGRNYPSARLVAKHLKLELPIITNDGAYIINHLENKPLFEKRIENEIIIEIVEVLLQYNLNFMILHESSSFGNFNYLGWKMFVRFFNIHSFKTLLAEKSRYRRISNNKIIEHIKNNKTKPFKIFVDGNHEQINEGRLELEEKFKDKIRITNSGYGIEILPLDISKASGLEILTGQLGFDKKEVIAIGDSFNDLEMIDYVGLGIAMGNAPLEIQNKAKFVTKTNDDDGVAHAIDEFFLKIKA